MVVSRKVACTKRRVRTARFVVLLAAVLVSWACEDQNARVGTAPAIRNGGSTPFTVSHVPDGYHLVSAGMGVQRPQWGDDSVGTDEPFTLLRRQGAAANDVVVVSTTGFEGYQGGLAQASRGYMGDPREVVVAGKPAIFTPAAGDRWADLVAEVGDDVAVRVTARGASREQLVDVLRQVEVPADRNRAPSVAEPPDDLEVVGSLDADAVVALRPWVAARSEQAPGPPTAHAAGWSGDDDQQTLSVLALPAGAVSLPALTGSAAFPPYGGTKLEMVTLEGRPAAFLEHEREGWSTRAVWLESDWGDTIVVTASGQETPDMAALRLVAESVQAADAPAWEAFVAEADGGPGLHPDHGRREITRGTVDDLEWLLQTGTNDSGLVHTGEAADPAADDGVDPCLKLSGRRRACPGTGFGMAHDWVAYTQQGENGMPPFIVVSTTADAVQVRVTTASGTAVAPLTALAGLPRAAVVVVDGLTTPFCPATGDGPGAPVATMRVEALDAAGNPVHCIGMSPAPGS